MTILQGFAGHQFGSWTVLGDAPYKKSEGRRVYARCSCGYEAIHYLGNLKSGHVSQCKKCRAEGRKRDRSFIGKVFGSWTVIKETEPDSHRRIKVLARCRCGQERIVRLDGLEKGVSTQCKSCATSSQSYRHGLINAPEYKIWLGMRDRCNNPNDTNYHNYGGRGIKVCDRWNSFENFYADMGDRPSSKHSIERKDVNRDYSPDNCCWATAKQQARNTRRTKMMTYQGQTKPLVQWAEELGLSEDTLRARVYTLKWADEKALSTPVRERS